MTDTTNLGLPLIEAAQAQKHVTHNEALRILDTLVQLAVLDRDLAAPPGSPTEGQRWLVAASPTGAWSGHAKHIAVWQDGAWQFCVPQIGWLVYVIDEGVLLAWTGSVWGDAITALTSLNNLALLGVGTTADMTNPFSAKLNNALWSAKTAAEGDDGNLRYKMSKESSAQTLSLLLQDNFSGRAEIGLIGDDDLHVKVSADGTTWREGIVINKNTGAVTFPNSSVVGGRDLLTASRTYYVRTDGSDSNNGLANTSGGAFLSIQKAVDTVAALDLGIYDAVIQVGNGTYTGAVSLRTLSGAGKAIIVGDETTPANVVVSVTSADAFAGAYIVGRWALRGLKIGTTTSGNCIHAFGRSVYIEFQNVEFGTCAVAHLYAEDGAIIEALGNYKVSGGALYHLAVATQSLIRMGVAANITATFSGTPSFSAQVAVCTRLGYLYLRSAGLTFSGTATGIRYSVSENSVVNTAAGGASFIPGNAAGSSTTGGQYL